MKLKGQYSTPRSRRDISYNLRQSEHRDESKDSALIVISNQSWTLCSFLLLSASPTTTRKRVYNFYLSDLFVFVVSFVVTVLLALRCQDSIKNNSRQDVWVGGGLVDANRDGDAGVG